MENWPYTNTHELNLDWILATVKKFEQEYSGIKTALDEAIEAIEQAGTDTTEEAIAALNEAKAEIMAAIAEAYRDAIADIPADYSALMAAFAPTFSSGVYPRGAVVWYDGDLYIFDAPHNGAWTGTDTTTLHLSDYAADAWLTAKNAALVAAAAYPPEKNILDGVPFNSGYYWDANQSKVYEATWGCYDPVFLKAGSYYLVNLSDALTWVENITTGEIAHPVSYHEGTVQYLYNIPFDCKLYISYNSVTAVTRLTHTQRSHYVEVGPNSEFPTIGAAIAATVDGDTIFIHSGTYTGQIELWNKPRHLIGESRETTFIVDHSGAYATPPVEMSEGSLENFTIIEDGANAAAGADMSAYCLHIEWEPQTANSGLYINNCTFINHIHAAVGCGLYQDYTVKFENCAFYTLADNEGNNERGAFFFHANVGTNITGQKMIVENSVICSAGDIAVYIGTPYAASGGACHYRFSGCTVWSAGKGNANDCVYIQSDTDTTIMQMEDSFGNTVEKLVSNPDPSVITVNVSGATPSITGKANRRYVCGTVTALAVQAPAEGCVDVIFTVGNAALTPAVTSAKPDTTVKWANGLSISNLPAGTYEMNILNGEWGVIGQWTT